MNKYPASVLIVGFGSVGQALLPLIIEKFALSSKQIQIIAADGNGRNVAAAYGIQIEIAPLLPCNVEASLYGRLHAGDWLLNLAVEVSSVALILWCRRSGVLYLDTCVEPWAGGYAHITNLSLTTNHALREQALQLHEPGTPTAIIAHGANPGIITHLAKAGLLELDKLRGVEEQSSWAALAAAIGVKVIQIAERDTQAVAAEIPLSHFVNTWSVPGFLAEAQQCAEVGWGTHEMMLAPGGVFHGTGDPSAIYMQALGIDVLVKSWVPSLGEQVSYLIPHHEATSLASLLTVYPDGEALPSYRPTVYYAYNPSPATAQSIRYWKERGRQLPARSYFLRDELSTGFDELGVLFVGSWGAFWYGSTLTLADARAIAPFNSATSLQVVAGILGALVWMEKRPNAGVVEAEDMHHEEVLAAAMPYLGQVGGIASPWLPRQHSQLQFDDFLVSAVAMEFDNQPEESVY